MACPDAPIVARGPDRRYVSGPRQGSAANRPRSAGCDAGPGIV